MSEPQDIEPAIHGGTHLFLVCASALVVGFLIWANFGVLDVDIGFVVGVVGDCHDAVTCPPPPSATHPCACFSVCMH